MPDTPNQKRPAADAATRKEQYARNLVFYVNDRRVEIGDPDPALLLVDYLRAPEVGLTGTKKSCGQGGCGACTVTLASYDDATGEVTNRAVNSCLRPVCSLDGMAVTTVEGLGSVKPEVSPDGVSPVQYRIAKCNGSQCGYCTPGFVMNMHSFLVANNDRPTTKAEIENLFDGSICRCTGFRPILYAMKSFASDWTPEDEAGTPPLEVDPAEQVRHYDRERGEFPPELKRPARAVEYRRGGHLWVRPLSLAAAHALLKKHRDTAKVKLVGGNTEVGIPDVLPDDPHVFIDISHLGELKGAAHEGGSLTVGASTTYSEFLDFLGARLSDATPAELPGLQALQYMARRTAGTIVRNAASLAGNTMLVVRNAVRGTPFPSDLFTVLACLGAELTVSTGEGGDLRLPLLDFVAQYNRDARLRRAAILRAYHVPLTAGGEFARAYKVALRQENAHSIVNACFKVRLGAGGAVEAASLVVGGIAPVAFHARKTEQLLAGRAWDAETLAAGLKALADDVGDAYRASRRRMRALPDDGIPEKYRLQLAESFFYKFFLHVAEQTNAGAVPERDRSAGELFERPVSKGTQSFEVYPDEFPVSRPVIKLSAFEQATGEARYTHDLALPPRGLYAAFVTSLRAVADFGYAIPGAPGVGVDARALLPHVAEKFPGVVDYITHLDIPPQGHNLQGGGKDDPLFCEGRVTCWGQSIGLVVAEDEQTAIDAAAYVRDECVAYTPTLDRNGKPLPVVLTIEEAIKHKSFFPVAATDDLNTIERPGSDLGWADGRADSVTLDGAQCAVVRHTQHTGSQAHFYMETQSCVALPEEGNALTVYPSSQSPNSIQGGIAATLGLQFNNIDVNIKRLGGAYGGKTTRSPFVASPVALAAWKLNRPVKIAMPRDVDMSMIGKRHAFRGDYQVAVVEEGERRGEILGAVTRLYSNAGNTVDCSFDVMDCSVAGSDGAYMIRNFKTQGTVCRTNLASNGAMRSYGGIQAALVQEDAIAAAAHRVGMLPEDVREKNLYRTSDTTPYGQSLEYDYQKDVWDRLKQTSDFAARLQKVREFNARNRWRKRGISMMPLKYGLGYNLGFLQQGAALIVAYTGDGTVLVHHGGVEMGQGMMTKMAQVAAYALNIPLRLVQMTAMNTNNVPNATGTGATSSSDINGGAIQQAGDELRRRLEAFCQQCQEWFGVQWSIDNGINYWDYDEGWQAEVATKGAPGKKRMMWLNVLGQAYQHRVDLSAQALYKTPGLGDTSDKNFYDYTYSAGCSEVEIDVLTGETTIIRSDLCYDMGKSMNPAIDIGQIEGAFVMGIGNVLSEELVYQPDGEQRGALNTTNTWTYKPPAHSSIPLDLRVEIFPRDAASEVRDDPNLLLSSKGVGEPPLVLAASVHGAVKQAVMAARQERGHADWFELRSPATVERVREACLVESGDLNLNP